MYLFNRNLPTLFETLERVTREFEDFNNNSIASSTSGPRINLYKGKDGLILTAKVSGVDPNDLDISFVGQALTIKGEYKQDVGEDIKFHRKEIKKGSFKRTLELPFRVEIDKVEAEFESGVLKINMPQAEADKPKKVLIKTSK
jgi:HSP20 family protein